MLLATQPATALYERHLTSSSFALIARVGFTRRSLWRVLEMSSFDALRMVEVAALALAPCRSSTTSGVPSIDIGEHHQEEAETVVRLSPS